jgi:hypothetical protein
MEDAARRRRTFSVAIGAIGLVILFAGAIASLLFPPVSYPPFIGLELAGLALIVVSFSRLRRLSLGIPLAPEKR